MITKNFELRADVAGEFRILRAGVVLRGILGVCTRHRRSLKLLLQLVRRCELDNAGLSESGHTRPTITRGRSDAGPKLLLNRLPVAVGVEMEVTTNGPAQHP